MDEAAFEAINRILTDRLGYEPQPSVKRRVTVLLTGMDQHMQSGEWEKALQDCNLLIQLQPDLAAAYNYRGVIYDELGNPEKAILDYQSAVHFDPEFKDSLERLLDIEQDLEVEFQESAAKNHLDQALEYINNGDPDTALAQCELARAGMPDLAAAYNYLGLILEEMEQVEPAVDAYLNAIRCNPHFWVARENLANATIRLEAVRFRQAAVLNAPMDELPEFTMDDLESAETPQTDDLLPEWYYLDETAFWLRGWPGHRTSQGRFGLDPLDTDFEQSHLQGVMIRRMFESTLRTRNPVYLIFMAWVGLLFCSPFLLLLSPIQGILYKILALLSMSPAVVVGILILNNVIKSMLSETTMDAEENGSAFY